MSNKSLNQISRHNLPTSSSKRSEGKLAKPKTGARIHIQNIQERPSMRPHILKSAVSHFRTANSRGELRKSRT